MEKVALFEKLFGNFVLSVNGFPLNMFLVIVCGSLISTLCALFQGLLENSSGLPI